MMTTIRCWIISETEKAYKLSKLPPDKNPHGHEFVWLPRSVCEHTTKMAADANGWREAYIKLPEWLAEKKDCCELPARH